MEKDKWDEICFLVSESIQKNTSENDFEINLIQVLRVLGWKRFLGEIQIRPPIQIGASNRLIPDFVINSSENRNLFVIEIKQPSLPLISSFQKQLFSYMRQLRLQYGLLIGQNIQVFYDGDLIDQDDPVLLETIDFDKGNPKGEEFVQLFSKDNFSNDALDAFTLSVLKKISSKTNEKRIYKKILSIDYKAEVFAFIKQDLLNEFDGELIDKVLEDISISIDGKSQHDVLSKKPIAKVYSKSETKRSKESTRDTTKYIISNNGLLLPKNRFVLEFIKLYINKHSADFNELKNIFKDEYQGSTGVINRLDDVEMKYANKSNKRHFVANDEILMSRDDVAFVVSTQWGKDNVGKIVDLARSKGFLIDET